jgi:hypothetical protein
MDEISNRTLAILLVAAIVISLGGTLISLNQLDRLKAISITGMQTKNTTLGNVSLEVQDLTWVNFSIWQCDFGMGFVKASACKMNSSGYENTTGCSPSWAPCSSALEIKNVGTNNVTLNISWFNSSEFITGTGDELWYKMLNGTNGTGASHGCQGTLTNTSWTLVSTEDYDHQVCDDFNYLESKGQYVHMHVQVVIPQDAEDGFKSNRVTAYAEKIGT